MLFAVLVYVTLDLSLPAMPGAFVFAPADSAESIQVRVRAATEAVAQPTQAREPGFVLFQPSLEVKERLVPVNERQGPPTVGRRSRACCDSSPPSEDPH